MAKLPIVTGEDNPTLRALSKKVEKITKAHLKLFKDMEDTMEGIGVGIAGPQVGILERLCLAQFSGKTNVLVNPEVVWTSDETDVMEEGCLSLPGTYINVTRPTSAIICYLDEKGREQERKLSGLDARIVLHEVEHLDGKLIVDYL